MSNPTPALVTQRGARPLPRAGLLALMAAYLLPGVVGREPWRNADITAFGQMAAMAEGRVPWLAPTLGGVAGDTALLPHWLGAAFIATLSPAVDAALAARLAFALLLALALALTWYTTLHLARTEAAQPLPFAFGGEADPVDYARAMADGAVLALMATLGLLQLGHETTPELAQLAAVSLFAYGLAAAPYRHVQPRVAVLLALPLLAGSGAPTMAVVVGLGGAEVCRRSAYPQVRRVAAWVLAATVAAALVAWAMGAWRWRALLPTATDLLAIPRQWAWFLWPAWPLALWTLWRWRRHLLHRHISVPSVVVAAALLGNLAMAGSDRALMLGLPGLAVLAAFALPTLKRSATAAIDWFSMFFFSLCAIAIWVIYCAMQTGVPEKPAANVAKLAPGFVPTFSVPELLLAVVGTACWMWLLRWRTGRHRDALWKSLVLPAGGVALCWLLLMTLWLPLLDYARSMRPWVERIAPHVAGVDCVAGPRLSTAQIAALEHHGRLRVDARSTGWSSPCAVSVRVDRSGQLPAAPSGWSLVATVKRPTDRDELTGVYRRIDPARRP